MSNRFLAWRDLSTARQDGVVKKGEDDKGDLTCEMNSVEDEGTSQEGAQVKPLRSPSAPSRQELLEHSLMNFPFRNWCPHCGMGKAKSRKHSVTGGKEESTNQIQPR